MIQPSQPETLCAAFQATVARVPDVVARIPNFSDDISDVDGLDAMSKYLFHGTST